MKKDESKELQSETSRSDYTINSPEPGPYQLHIVHLYPDLLNLYGDRGNIQCLRMRCKWRGIDTLVTECNSGDRLSLASADIVLLGGGSDREQQIVCTRLQKVRRHYYDTPEGRMEGLSLVDLYTEQGSPRLISDIVLSNDTIPELSTIEIVGFENHGGRTYIGDNMPFGKVIHGYGNNGKDASEGVLYRNVIGTYLHGPLLPKNPDVSDYLLQKALDRKYGISLSDFPDLDDSLEIRANQAAVFKHFY